ncbi:unnamed protein product [Colias eurytheme]|nr:unnamed protein product [Colias eurytheme]
MTAELLLLLILLVKENTAEHCDVQSEESNKRCFVKQTLATLPHSPNQLAVDKLTNTLYFSFDAGQGEYLPAALQLDTKRLTVLKGVKDAFAIASDEENGEVYFGGSHGIYRYNPVLKTLKRLLVKNLDIWWLVLKSDCTLSGSRFVFDAEDNIFFINGTGLFGIKNNSTSPILLKDNPRFLGMAIDNSSHVHLCSESSIYVISQMVQKVKKIVSIAGVLGIGFDRDNNLIYSDSHELIRLMPVNSKS